jgi:hypothetical protein
MGLMFTRSYRASIVIALFVFAACTNNEASREGQKNKADGPPQATPSKAFTAADVAKLKWIEGTWRGMDGEKPFFERYRIEETAMVVEGLTDESVSKVESTDRFELKDGEFGKGEGEKRSAASAITADYIQFVPAVPGRGNNFRFERQADGTWNAILEWPATAEKPARQKVYKMEPWPPRTK